MKTLKRIGIGLAILIVLLVGIAYLLPRYAKVEKSLVMEANAAAVHNLVNDLKRWDDWSPWHNIDSTAHYEYSSPAVGKGAYYSWKGNKEVGEGTLTIMESTPSLIVTKLNFQDQGEATARFRFEPAEKGVKVTWDFESDLGFNPMARWFGLFMESFIGPDYEKGLKNLDSAARKEPAAPANAYAVEEVELKPGILIGLRKKTTPADMGKTLGELFGQLTKFVETNKLEMTGAPLALTYVWEPEKNLVDVEAALPVSRKVAPSGGIRVWEQQPIRMAKTVHYGSYESSEAGHQALSKWMEAAKKTPKMPVWEEYITDPMQEPDTSKWVTHIYYPL